MRRLLAVARCGTWRGGYSRLSRLSIRKGDGIFFTTSSTPSGCVLSSPSTPPQLPPRADGNTLSPSLPLVGRRFTALGPLPPTPPPTEYTPLHDELPTTPIPVATMTFIVRSSRISCVREVRKTVELSLEEMKRLETVVMEIVSEFAEKIDTST